MITKEKVKQVEEWLDATMHYLLHSYDLEMCLEKFATGSKEMPRGETKVCLDAFVMDYIQTLGIAEDTTYGKNKRDRPPSNCPTSNRALVMFGGDGKSAWDTPLFEAMSTPEEANGIRAANVTNTKHDEEITLGDDTITRLTDDLSLKK